jgi:integrase
VLLGRGVHQKIVSEMLGHASTSITDDIYAHVTPTMQRAVTNVIDAAFGAAR